MAVTEPEQNGDQSLYEESSPLDHTGGYTDVMVDLETLGNNSRSPIIQIGVVGFNIETGEVNEPVKWCTRPDLEKYEPDLSTIYWWMTQSEEARQSVFSHPVIPLSVALSHFNDYWEKCLSADREKTRVWSMPASFDLVILENAFRTEGLKSPWYYRGISCMRTLCALAGINKEDRVVPPIEHDAGWDAYAQAQTACHAWHLLNRGKGE